MSDAASKDTPGVIAPPPLIFLGHLLAGFALDWQWPLPLAPANATERWLAGAALIVLGIALMAAGIATFTRAHTPVPTREPTRALVTSGIHRLTRNPIYLGMFAIYLGLAVAADNLWLIILLAPLTLIIGYGVVAREEAYLDHKFPDDYRAYKKRTPRWL